MRLLLTSNAMHDPPRGGSARSNLAWLRPLASRGHECRIVCPAPSARNDIVERDGIVIRRVSDLARNVQQLVKEIETFQPDWVAVSSEDVSHVLLREGHRVASNRLIYLAHTPQFFPFGPESWNPDPRGAAIIRKARAVVVIGRHMAGYVREHLGVDARVVHPAVYGDPPYARYGSFDSGDVLMINPCAVKGLSILLALAREFPHLIFAGLAGWGTTSEDRKAMARLPNVRVVETVPSIETVLANARLLLMPSLWYEGFGLIVMEAMLRGVPVISSNSGGLAEAKQGTGYIIPVRPIKRYEHLFEENNMPRPVVEEQDITPWTHALKELTTERERYEEESRRSRAAALSFVSALQATNFEELLLSLGKEQPLRILLAHNSLYLGSHGGGDKSNRLLMEGLAQRGHVVRVMARVEQFGEQSHREFIQQLTAKGISPCESTGEAVCSKVKGVEIHTLTRNPYLRAYFARQIAEFDPDIIIGSTDDPAQLLLDLAVQCERARVVYLIRAPIALPFGPDSSSVNPERAARLQLVDCVVGVSEYVAQYARQYGNLAAVHVPISLMERRAFEALGKFNNPFVLMANPCAVKGISIFLELARSMAHLRFAAIPTWGTTPEDLAALESIANVTVLPPSDNMDEIFAQTCVLLVPSLWAEARSRIVVEAMACGVPVIASNTGGLPEAKLGVPYVLPVNPIRRYKGEVDSNMVPVAEVPPQDVGPWREALDRLTYDPAHWQEIASASRRAAQTYIDNLDVRPFESILRDVFSRPRHASSKTVADRSPTRLSPERQRLLAIRLRQRAGEKCHPWFPFVKDLRRGERRLFIFPYAGGGALAWRGWQERLDAQVSVCPVRLPGREARRDETPFENMAALIESLEKAIRPLVNTPFVFFGHSMGAGIAFELTRALRRAGQPMPELLIVSGARAPKLREPAVSGSELSDADLIAQLRRLDGMPPEILNDPLLVREMLPALRADLELYRRYLPAAEAALDVPIAAYAGASDPNVVPEDVAAWRSETTQEFRFRTFSSGHFFIHSRLECFLHALQKDIADLCSSRREPFP